MESKIPPILLEGDEPAVPPSAARGALENPPATPGPAELPESYGTGRLHLKAQDPQCLYADWDVAAEEQRQCIQDSIHHRLVLRIHQENLGGPVVTEQHVSPEARHTFVSVPAAGSKYVAQLGYYPPHRPWQAVAASESAQTPGHVPVADETLRFGTLVFPIADRQPLTAESAAVGIAPSLPEPSTAEPSQTPRPRSTPTEIGPLAEGEFPLVRSSRAAVAAPGGAAEPVIPELESEEQPAVEAYAMVPEGTPATSWTPAQEQALAQIIGRSVSRKKFVSSRQIEDLVRAGLLRVDSAWSAVPAGPSSAALVPQLEARGFWLNVNAELVIYGATEPGSVVTMGGRPVRLEPDGSFSYRFALPDGTYPLPITAISAEGAVREVLLQFERNTQNSTGVEAAPPEPGLRPPRPESIH